MSKKKAVLLWVVSLVFILGTAGYGMAAWGGKELETEKTAVNLSREVARGGYKIVNTEELKAWLDQKKDMLIVDTMPYEDSYKKQHIPGQCSLNSPKKKLQILMIKQRRHSRNSLAQIKIR